MSGVNFGFSKILASTKSRREPIGDVEMNDESESLNKIEHNSYSSTDGVVIYVVAKNFNIDHLKEHFKKKINKNVLLEHVKKANRKITEANSIRFQEINDHDNKDIIILEVHLSNEILELKAELDGILVQMKPKTLGY